MQPEGALSLDEIEALLKESRAKGTSFCLYWCHNGEIGGKWLIGPTCGYKRYRYGIEIYDARYTSRSEKTATINVSMGDNPVFKNFFLALGYAMRTRNNVT